MPAALPSFLLAVAALLLARAVWTDLRRREIGNRLTLALALIAPFWWWSGGWSLPAIGWQMGLAAATLLIFAGLFALGLMGGGDVKLIAAIALWLPFFLFLQMLWWMALAGGALTLAMLAYHRVRRPPDPLEVPYGVAIAVATVGVMANHILTNAHP